MNPSAVLSVMIQAKGFEKVSAQLAAIDESGKRAERSLADIEKQNKRTGDSTDKLEKKFSNLDNTVGDFNRSMTGLRNIVGLVKFPALIAGAGAAAQAIGALGAGGIALTSALGPLSGALAAYPALLAAAGQGMGVVKLATSGLDKALQAAVKGGKDYEKALKELTPEQRAFVESLKPVLEQFKQIRKEAQAGLLPGLSDAVKDASKNVGVLKPIVRGTAEELGNLARRAGELVGSKGFGKDLQTVGQSNITILGKLGSAALHLFNALRNVTVVAQPLVRWMADLADQFAIGIDRAAKLGRENGHLAGFFDKTRSVMQHLVSIASNLGQVFWEIGKAAAPLGREILADIDRLTAKFRDWAKSTQGRATLAQYFRDAKAPLYAAVGLVGDLSAAFLRLTKPSDMTTGLFEQLRKLVPVLENLVTTTTASLGPALLQALVPLVQVFGDLAGSSGPLTQTVRLIGLLASGLHEVLQEVPGLNQLAVFSFGAYGSVKALTLVFGPLTAAIGAATVALIGQEAAANSAGIANLRLRISMVATALAMSAATVAQIALNVAMYAFPALAIIGAIVLVATHWKEFKAIISDVWEWIQGHWPLLAGILAGPIGLAVAEIIKHAGDIKNAVVGAFNGLVGAVHNLAATIVGLGSWTINRIVDGMHAATAGLLSIGGWLRNRLMDGLNAVADAMRSVGGWVINRVVEGAKATTAGLLSIGGWMKNRVLDGLNAVIDTVRSLGGWIMNRVVEGIRATTEGILGIGGWVKNRLLEGLTSVKDGIVGLGGSIIGWIVDGLKAGANKIVDFLNDIIGVINKLPGVDIAKVKGFAEGGKYQGDIGKYARGGAYGRTGGMVGAPITLMGEEAPKYPEYVIPTNPAYRKRARGLLAQAAGTLGFASGGVYSFSELEDVWMKAGGAQGSAAIMAHIAQAESGGNPLINYGGHVGRIPGGGTSIAAGLWQILGLPFPGDVYDPMTNARMAIAKSSNGRNLQPWVSSKDVWGQYLAGGGGGVLGAVGGIIGDLFTKGADFLIGQLPDVGDLPDWMKGLGKYVLDKVGGFITDKVDGVLGAAFTGGGNQPTNVPGNGKFPAGPHAADLMKAVALAQQYGLTITATTNGQHAANSWHYAGRAFDASNGTNTPQELKFAQQMIGLAPQLLELFYDPMGQYVKNGQIIAGAIGGHSDHVHVAMRKGGIYGPYVGAYQNGGVVPQTGLAMVHRGETITPAGGATTVVEHHYHGPVVQDQEFIKYLRNLDTKYGRQNGRPAFGG